MPKKAIPSVLSWKRMNAVMPFSFMFLLGKFIFSSLFIRNLGYFRLRMHRLCTECNTKKARAEYSTRYGEQSFLIFFRGFFIHEMPQDFAPEMYLTQDEAAILKLFY